MEKKNGDEAVLLTRRFTSLPNPLTAQPDRPDRLDMREPGPAASVGQGAPRGEEDARREDDLVVTDACT